MTPRLAGECVRTAHALLLRSGVIAGDRRDVAIAEAVFHITAEGLARLEQSASSLDARKDLLREFENYRRVLKQLFVRGLDKAQEHLRALQELVEQVISTDEQLRIREEEMACGNYAATKVYLRLVKAASQRVVSSPLYHQACTDVDIAGGRAARTGRSVGRAGDRGDREAEYLRRWRNGLAGASGFAAGVGAAGAAGAFGAFVMAPPAVAGAFALSLMSSVFSLGTHSLARRNDETNKAYRELCADLEKLADFSFLLVCNLQQANMVINTVQRNMAYVNDVMSEDWSQSSNAAKKLCVCEAMANFRVRVSAHNTVIVETQKKLTDLRTDIFP